DRRGEAHGADVLVVERKGRDIRRFDTHVAGRELDGGAQERRVEGAPAQTPGDAEHHDPVSLAHVPSFPLPSLAWLTFGEPPDGLLVHGGTPGQELVWTKPCLVAERGAPRHAV